MSTHSVSNHSTFFLYMCKISMADRLRKRNMSRNVHPHLNSSTYLTSPFFFFSFFAKWTSIKLQSEVTLRSSSASLSHSQSCRPPSTVVPSSHGPRASMPPVWLARTPWHIFRMPSTDAIFPSVSVRIPNHTFLYKYSSGDLTYCAFIS